MSDEKKKIQKWGYHPTEEARIFELSEGEDLPEGWAARPVPKGGAQAEPEAKPEPVKPEGKDTGEIDGLHAEIAGLKSELEQAYARITELESFEDEELEIPHPGAPKAPNLIVIPDDWREIHHSTRMKLAKTLSPEMADAIEKDADAIEIIEAELAKRG